MAVMKQLWRAKSQRWALGGIAAGSFLVLTQLATRDHFDRNHWIAIHLLTSALLISMTTLYHEELSGRVKRKKIVATIHIGCYLTFFFGMAAFLASFSEKVAATAVIACALTIMLIESDRHLVKRSRTKDDTNESSTREGR